MRDYGKVHTSFWSSDTIRSMSEDGRALALYLITCPHNTIAGVFRLPDGYACEDMQWEADRVAGAMSELAAHGFAYRCDFTKWVWVCKHLDWNLPENPNQRKSGKKIALSVPPECSWRTRFLFEHGAKLDIPPPLNRNGFATVAEGLREPFANQEQEQDQEIGLVQEGTELEVSTVAGGRT